MKLGDIDWSVVDKEDIYVVQHKLHGSVFVCSQNWLDTNEDNLTVLSKRPKPQLTKEQIEAVREYDEWLVEEAECYKSKLVVDEWLKQRGGEHE